MKIELDPAKLLALQAEATPQPWEANGCSVTTSKAFVSEWEDTVADCAGVEIRSPEQVKRSEVDARLIVAAVNALPFLLLAMSERDRLRAAIVKHRSQKADDRCVEDDDELYRALGDGIPCDRRVGCKADMLKNCARFIDKRTEEGGWPTYAELEAERDALREAVDELFPEGELKLVDTCYGMTGGDLWACGCGTRTVTLPGTKPTKTAHRCVLMVSGITKRAAQAVARADQLRSVKP